VPRPEQVNGLPVVRSRVVEGDADRLKQVSDNRELLVDFLGLRGRVSASVRPSKWRGWTYGQIPILVALGASHDVDGKVDGRGGWKGPAGLYTELAGIDFRGEAVIVSIS
jgi:hypothetical protein